MKTNFLIPVIAAAFIFSSCNKNPDPDPTTPPSGNTSVIGSFFSDNVNDAKQNFTVNASTGGAIHGAEGGMVYFFPNSFVDAGGAPITGNIDVELIEVYDQASMVLLNKTTTSGGELLVSGGEFKISASQNGNELELAPGASYWANIPTQNPDPQMELFYADEDADGDLDWLPADSIGLNDSVNIVQDSTGWAYDFYGSDLGWINCDYFYSDPNPKTTVEVVTPAGYDDANTEVYMHATAFNSVAPFWWENPNGGFKSYTDAIPIGLQTTLIVISEINGQYYSAFVPITVANNHVENVTMTATTLADITSDINNL